MRAEARTQGTIESGFERAPDGWHVVKVEEGIAHLMKKGPDGTDIIATNKSGDKLWKIPLVIDDDDDEANGIKVDSIAPENKRGEQLVTDFLGATGLFKKFSEKFPGDVSVFADNVMVKVKTSLQGQFLRIKTKQNEYTDAKGQKQTAVNIVGFGPMNKTIEQLEGELFPAKEEKKGGKSGGKGAGKGDEKKADVPDDNWD